MSVYDANGSAIESAYSAAGASMGSGYDWTGNALQISDSGGHDDELDFDLTVMTFNVQHWTGINADATLINKIITDYDPDIIGFQEGSLPASGFSFAEVYTPYDGTGIGIGSKIPVSDHQVVRYQSQSTQYTRYFQKGYITLQGKQIAVYNTHMEYVQYPVNASQMQELRESAANDEYAIFLGDFNIRYEDKTGTEYLQSIKPWVDAGYTLANWVTGINPFVETWFRGTAPVGYAGGQNGDQPCDNVIVTPNIEIVKKIYDRQKITANTGLTIDHTPIICRLKIREGMT